ncbi:hypothetical protein AAFF_G00078580 [Aldrovandia affinis]|uniref:Uncharacterized protein n=1 Tax=Aldrovandia affinis TaxID=143900 RepID=A0AAD7WCI9_9TELE|nr:hypothetical protein AAFF_G00078580 [Aldrovandia affinis]
MYECSSPACDGKNVPSKAEPLIDFDLCSEAAIMRCQCNPTRGRQPQAFYGTRGTQLGHRTAPLHENCMQTQVRRLFEPLEGSNDMSTASAIKLTAVRASAVESNWADVAWGGIVRLSAFRLQTVTTHGALLLPDKAVLQG